MDGGGPIEGVGIMGMDDDLDAMPPSASQMDLASQTSDDTTVGMAPVAKRRSGIRVLTEGTTVMVLPTGVSKAHALRDIMAHLYSRHAEPEFILVVGSGGNVAGANDEEAAFRTFDARQIYMPDKARSWTCAVGSHASEAKFFLDDPTQVVDLLTAMDESRKTGGSGMKRNAFSSASLSSRSSAPEDGRCAPVLLMTLASTRQAHSHTHTLSLFSLFLSLSLSLSLSLFCSGFFSKDKMRSNLAEGLGVRRALKQLNDDTLTSAPAMLASPSTSSGSLAGPPPGLGFTPGSKTESGSTPSSPATNPKSKRRVARFAVLAWLVERRGSSKLVVAAAAALLLLAGECAEPCCIPCWSLFVVTLSHFVTLPLFLPLSLGAALGRKSNAIQLGLASRLRNAGLLGSASTQMLALASQANRLTAASSASFTGGAIAALLSLLLNQLG